MDTELMNDFFLFLFGSWSEVVNREPAAMGKKSDDSESVPIMIKKVFAVIKK